MTNGQEEYRTQYKANTNAQFPSTRMRRLRRSGWMREMVTENRLTPADLILPLFIIEGTNTREPITSMPDVNRLSIDNACETAQRAQDIGIPAIALFPAIDSALKDEQGSEALNPDNLICRAIQAIKQAAPDIGIITDIALDPYTTHGHDGVLGDKGDILNDESVEILCKQALTQAQAGADIIAPSDMMDGRIGAIRNTLENNDFKDCLLYTSPSPRDA